MSKEKSNSFENIFTIADLDPLGNRAGEKVLRSKEEFKREIWWRIYLTQALTRGAEDKISTSESLQRFFLNCLKNREEKKEPIPDFLRILLEDENQYTFPHSLLIKRQENPIVPGYYDNPPKPGCERSVEKFLWVFPREKIRTNKMPMKKVIIGPAELMFHSKTEEFIASLPKHERKRFEEKYPGSPVGILSYPFNCVHFGNNFLNLDEGLTGNISHVVINSISFRKTTRRKGNPFNFYPQETVFNLLIWDKESQNRRKSLGKKVENSTTLAYKRQFWRMIRPYSGGTPGLGKNS